MLIHVKVFPASLKQEVIKKSEDSLEVKVISKPERGMATEETAALLSTYFKVSRTSVRLIKGAKLRNKLFEIKSY
jgi:uncharacterized protein YggU (UPF0235/DUF167 family)